MDMPAYSAVI